ncbi:PREDICTED: F-box/kelch-repeat protein At3g06570-like [Camelina sativa]|uniref:F-box/kelch-repeat protein At3g06570-like n=1 Tax=Camelina sativa TaxID=90675 RepID=A0ABM0WXY4_CAMSA|nr:PREDICTED: F-box/kelch-repeat protein At3g06570-like [Camelina sativa]
MSSPPPEKKRSMITFDSLTQDLIVSIIARVPREYYPTLSLVSKRFRALLVSPELYKARSLSNHTETCLYVCIEDDPDYHWFTLSRKPDQTLTSDDDDDDDEEKKSSGYLLSRVPVTNSPPGEFWNLVTVGSEIYNIAGSRYEDPRALSSVSILDCRTHTWSKAPNLGVELWAVSACAHDRMIYVVGRYEEESDDSGAGQVLLKSFFEVLDTKTQTWHPLPANEEDIISHCSTEFVNGKLHVMPWMASKCGVVAYNSKEARWEQILEQLAVRNKSLCRTEHCASQ